MTELLAPAGSLEALRAAVNAGADAVYIGGRAFGARAYAENPDESGLIEGIEYCHLRGKKLYLTVNTLLKERELRKDLISFLEPLYAHGIDALIIQDLGVLRFLRAYYPDLELHASTQMSVTTPEGAMWLKTLGIGRVVPARELSLNEVRSIVQSGMEVETFVHGAMCYCYSGRCLFSSMLGGRSGNRGRCAQPCRLPYTFEEEASFCYKDVPLPDFAVGTLNAKNRRKAFEGLRTGSSSADPACLLSLKDMCTLDILPDLIDAGIASFKIEGRMKPPQYSAGVTSVYRNYLELFASVGRAGNRVLDEDRRSLSDLFV
ncbi:MAG: U32 family peptidase, partial [Lachnospiraceae bacterium]|nr:U32 family peptidase [Lachnospiraceae bacterium]